MELRAGHAALADEAREAALLDRRRGQHAARRGVLHGVAVREVAGRRKGGRERMRRAAGSTSFQPMCGSRRAPVSRVGRSRAGGRGPAVSPSSLRANSSCMPTHTPNRCAPLRRAPMIASSRPRSRSASMAAAACPTPGMTTNAALATSSGRSLTATSAPARSKAARSERRLPAP